MVLNYILVEYAWLNGRQSYILSIFPFSVLKTLTATQATHIVTARNSKCNCVWSFSRKTLCGSILVYATKKSSFSLRWAQKTKPCFVTLRTFFSSTARKGVWDAREKRGAREARFSRTWPETPFPFLPSPPRPPLPSFFCFRSNFHPIIRLETLATQVICLLTLTHEYSGNRR